MRIITKRNRERMAVLKEKAAQEEAEAKPNEGREEL